MKNWPFQLFDLSICVDSMLTSATTKKKTIWLVVFFCVTAELCHKWNWLLFLKCGRAVIAILSLVSASSEQLANRNWAVLRPRIGAGGGGRKTATTTLRNSYVRPVQLKLLCFFWPNPPCLLFEADGNVFIQSGNDHNGASHWIAVTMVTANDCFKWCQSFHKLIEIN